MALSLARPALGGGSGGVAGGGTRPLPTPPKNPHEQAARQRNTYPYVVRGGGAVGVSNPRGRGDILVDGV